MTTDDEQRAWWMVRVDPVFAWYDAWVGFYWDREKRWLYVLPIPFLGLVFKFRTSREMERKA